MGQEIKAKAVELAQAMPGFFHKMVLKSLPVGFEVGLSVPQLSKKEVLAWWESSQIEGSFFSGFLKKLESNTVDRVVSVSRRSLVLHEDPLKTGKRIQQALDVSRRSASTLLNTALQEAVNYGELEYYKENSARIPKTLFVAELDRHTCPLCRELDGEVYDTKEAAQSKPPLHANCRCRLFPVFAAGDIYGGIDEAKRTSRKETNPRTIKHRDGSTSTEFTEMEAELVPFKTTYNEWMTSMVNGSAADQKFAREALGPTRFNLVKSGKLEMGSLYYQGRLRKISELEELI
jgi:SPP1 gp7 family putative phage head morphogenesis protein